MQPTKRLLNIADIVIKPEQYQSRVDGVDDFEVDDLVKTVLEEAGDEEIPDLSIHAVDFTDRFPLTVFYTPQKQLLLVGGFHRIEMASRLGAKTVWCDVVEGTDREAEFHALTEENKKHGRKLKSKDHQYRLQRLLSDAEWGIFSDETLAKKVGVHKTLVGRIRKKMEADQLRAPLPDTANLPIEVIAKVQEMQAAGENPRVYKKGEVMQVTDANARTKDPAKKKTVTPTPQEEKAPEIKPKRGRKKKTVQEKEDDKPVDELDNSQFESRTSDRFRLKDKAGHLVPKQLKDIFEPATGYVGIYELLIKNLQNIDERMGEQEYSNQNPWLFETFLQVGRKKFNIRQVMEWLIKTLKNCRIYSVCPFCKDGERIGCDHCQNKGYLTEFAYKELLEMKEKMDAEDAVGASGESNRGGGSAMEVEERWSNPEEGDIGGTLRSGEMSSSEDDDSPF